MKADAYDRYDYLPVEIIAGAIMGDRDAWRGVIERYSNYVHKYFKNKAISRHELNYYDIPVEDLLHEIWAKVMEVIEAKFRI